MRGSQLRAGPRAFSRSGKRGTSSSSWAGWSPNFRREIRQSHYRNDPVKYDLKGLKFEGAYINALSQTLPLGYDFS